MQLAQHDLIELRPDRVDLDLPDHFFSKTICQQVAPKLRTDAARFEIKQLFRIDLADRRAVRALHIVRINLELRLRIYARFIGQQKILVRLLRVRLLRALTNEYFAVENRAAVAVENALVQLVTRAMRLLVINHRMRVSMLIGADHVET